MNMYARAIMNVAVLVFAAIQWTVAQSVLHPENRFMIECDLAQFAGDDTHNVVELYYGIQEGNLSYRSDSLGYNGTVVMRYEVRTDTSLMTSKGWRIPHRISDTLALQRRQIMTGLESFSLPEGTYRITLSAWDMYNMDRRDSLSIPVTIHLFPKDHEAFSDVELCTSIQASSSQQSVFYKNTLEVIPNPNRLYGTGLPILYYYLEVYNLHHIKDTGYVTIHTAIIDVSGKELVAHDKVKPRMHDASVEIGTLNLSAIRGGTYLFRADILDSSKNNLATSSKKFFVYRAGAQSDTSRQSMSADFSTSEFAVMSGPDVDQQFEYAKYLANDLERKQYLILTDVAAKRKFMYEFWSRRNPDPSNAENTFKKEYFDRIDYCDKNFGQGLKPGWKTDRGRVYILYGPSNEVERNPSSSDSNPYEIWHYQEIQGGVIFVFVDTHNLGDFMLVHSTHRNEIADENWYQDYAVKTQ